MLLLLFSRDDFFIRQVGSSVEHWFEKWMLAEFGLSNLHVDQHKLQANKNRDVNDQGFYADQSNLCLAFVLPSVSGK